MLLDNLYGHFEEQLEILITEEKVLCNSTIIFEFILIDDKQILEVGAGILFLLFQAFK